MDFLGGLRTDFAQREHLVTLFLMPYLFAAARRFDGEPLLWRHSVPVGLAAAVSLSLKPHYLLIVPCVEALLLYRSRCLKDLLRAELMVIAMGGITYCALVWLFTPSYVTETIPLLAEMYGYYDAEPKWQILINHKRLIEKALFAIAWLVLLQFKPRNKRLLGTAWVLCAASGGALAALIIQGKDWSDHTLPTEIFVDLALALLALDLVRQWATKEANERSANRAAATAVTAIVSVLALMAYLPVRAAAFEKTQLRRELVDLNDATSDLPAMSPVYVLTQGIDFQFYFTITRGLIWASKSPCVWLQASIANAEWSGSASHNLSLKGSIGRSTELLVSLLKNDFVQWRPSVVLALRCSDPECKHSLDLVQWFSSRDGDFATIWSQYVWVKHIGRFDLYRLRDDG
jgi:hypothetical protein